MEKIQENNRKDYNFTPREKDILSLLANGIRNEEIANTLCIEPTTVKAHLTNIYKKLGVETKIQAVVKIFDESLIPRQGSKQP